jgi:mono/diheme cytochrome c family protein
MPTVRIECPSCAAGLRVRSERVAAARIVCPKCKTGFQVPDEDEEEQAPQSVTPARPGKAAPRRIEDEDSDEPVKEGRPRRHRRKKQKQTARNPALVVVLVIGAVLLVGGAVTLAVILMRGKSRTEVVAQNNQTPPPAPSTTGPGPARQRQTPPNEGRTKTEPPTASGTGEVAAGRRVYDANNCARCHSIDSSGGGGGPNRGRKKDLSRVGAHPEHTAAWIGDHIRDPKAHNPGSRMPAYKDKINAEDLRALSEYLASLK